MSVRACDGSGMTGYKAKTVTVFSELSRMHSTGIAAYICRKSGISDEEVSVMNKIPYDITFHPSWWHKNAGIDFSQPFFDDPDCRMEADLVMRRTLYDHFGKYGIGQKDPRIRPLMGTDLLAAGYLYSEMMGCKIIYQPDNSPQVICRDLSAEDLDQVEAVDLDTSPVWARMQRQIDALLAKYGRVETYINLQGIQNIALDLMGQELYLAYYTDPDEISALLEKITDLTIEVGKRFYALSQDVSGGVTGIVRQVMPENYLTSNCSVEMVSNDCYEEFLLPHDIRLAKAFSCFGIHHCGKSMEHVCEGYAKVPNLKFAEVGAGSDVAYVRDHLPGVWLNLRYSAVEIQNQTPDQVREKVQNLLRLGRAEEGNISISCVGMDKNTPEENILAFLDACYEANYC